MREETPPTPEPDEQGAIVAVPIDGEMRCYTLKPRYVVKGEQFRIVLSETGGAITFSFLKQSWRGRLYRWWLR